MRRSQSPERRRALLSAHLGDEGREAFDDRVDLDLVRNVETEALRRSGAEAEPSYADGGTWRDEDEGMRGKGGRGGPFLS